MLMLYYKTLVYLKISYYNQRKYIYRAPSAYKSTKHQVVYLNTHKIKTQY
jgi:hypothetical protein